MRPLVREEHAAGSQVEHRHDADEHELVVRRVRRIDRELDRGVGLADREPLGQGRVVREWRRPGRWSAVRGRRGRLGNGCGVRCGPEVRPGVRWLGHAADHAVQRDGGQGEPGHDDRATESAGAGRCHRRNGVAWGEGRTRAARQTGRARGRARHGRLRVSCSGPRKHRAAAGTRPAVRFQAARPTALVRDRSRSRGRAGGCARDYSGASPRNFRTSRPIRVVGPFGRRPLRLGGTFPTASASRSSDNRIACA